MLILGADRTRTFLDHLAKLKRYLLVDDGSVSDQLTFPPTWRVTHLDLYTHSLNPLARMTYLKAVQLVEALLAGFPGGADTLTKEGAGLVLLENVLENKSRTLSKLISHPNPKDTGEVKAAQMLERVLLSPVLKSVFDRPTNLTMTGIVIARLPPAELGEFDAKLLGRLLINAYPGPIIIPDFGLYAIPSHIQLIRQKRVIAGLSFLDEVDTSIRRQLLMDETIWCRTSFDDAEELARNHCRYPRGTDGYGTFIAKCMGN